MYERHHQQRPLENEMFMLCYILKANVTMYQLNGRKTIIKTVKFVSIDDGSMLMFIHN